MSNETGDSDTAPKKKRGCGEWAVLGVTLVFGVSILGAIITPKTPEEQIAERSAKVAKDLKAEQAKKAAEEARWASAAKVTAVELYRAYQANEARAQRDYGGKPLEVRGTVESISLGMGDVPFLELATDNQYMSAHVELTEEGQAASVNLSKGQEVLLLCEGVSEIAGRPMLKECEIV